MVIVDPIRVHRFLPNVFRSRRWGNLVACKLRATGREQKRRSRPTKTKSANESAYQICFFTQINGQWIMIHDQWSTVSSTSNETSIWLICAMKEVLPIASFDDWFELHLNVSRNNRKGQWKFLPKNTRLDTDWAATEPILPIFVAWIRIFQHNKQLSHMYTRKIDILNPKSWRWMVQMIFLFNWVLFRFQPLIFVRGVVVFQGMVLGFLLSSNEHAVSTLKQNLEQNELTNML